jgi:signal transduction histidine kinase
LAPRRARGLLHIGARLEGDHLELRVTDDGVGFGTRPEAAPPGIGLGLQNVRARLAQLHGSDGTLTLVPAVPQGTVAIIRIPYRVCPADPTPTLADA